MFRMNKRTEDKNSEASFHALVWKCAAIDSDLGCAANVKQVGATSRTSTHEQRFAKPLQQPKLTSQYKHRGAKTTKAAECGSLCWIRHRDSLLPVLACMQVAAAKTRAVQCPQLAAQIEFLRLLRPNATQKIATKAKHHAQFKPMPVVMRHQ